MEEKTGTVMGVKHMAPVASYSNSKDNVDNVNAIHDKGGIHVASSAGLVSKN